MQAESHAGKLASYLPGGRDANFRYVVELRGRRVLKLERAGLTRADIYRATGWTPRQQRYAVRSLAHA